MFKKILVPLDGSDLAEWALQPALKLAVATKGEVILLRSLIPVYMSMPIVANEHAWVWPEYIGERVQQQATTYLQTVQQEHQHPDVTIRIMTVEGDAASLIVDTADEQNVDLIVMSTHGWSGMKKGALGSVTERVLGTAPCPVLVTRSSATISRILLTLDGSTLAEEALAPGGVVAAALQARMTLLAINEPLMENVQNEVVQEDWEHSAETQQVQQQNREAAETYLEDVAAQHVPADVVVKTEVIDGPVVDKILGFAALHNIDLIVMSTHGRTGLQRWLYGSVTSKVMHSSNCSMLIVRPPFIKSG